MREIFGRNRWDKTSWPTMNHSHPKRMKLTIPPTHIYLPIFIMPLNNINRIFTKSRSFSLIANNPQIHLIFLIILNIQSKTSKSTNTSMINHIFFLLIWFHLNTYLCLMLLFVFSFILFVLLLIVLMKFIFIFMLIWTCCCFLSACVVLGWWGDILGLGVLICVLLLVVDFLFLVVWHDDIFNYFMILSIYKNGNNDALSLHSY